eukprot:CAMPEP_0119043770 /NCGR_PEP_ID=MMETSP1177-20130426/25875_1 /TAXON_ID=2985 /ORGANISM="Ochromonas sp, Strain CCMP1899" /LENGTH=520 /DNA_ID=CAMNT_0007012659 /DNA_START=289 /DNA_END=1851 /DNA_ORIENTATION=+
MTNCLENSTSDIIEKEKPIYKRIEIKEHTTKEKGIWVTHGNGVYDITKFVVNHPGGQEKISLAAGNAVESYWKIYRQHYNKESVENALKSMLIGYLHPDDFALEAEEDELSSDDPYSADPPVSPVQTFHQKYPVNSEAPSTLLNDTWLTPKDMWFKRNHHPVPHPVTEEYRLSVAGPSTGHIEISLNDLKTKFKKYKVTSAIQCGGNRRSEMNEVGKTNGSPWGIAAISNAEWEGVRLLDVLRAAGYGDEEALAEAGIKHVQFMAAEGMEASIPLHKAMDLYGDVLLAYEMNGETLSPSHGYPIRVVVPGHAGVRNVKWLTGITLSAEESQGPWQRGMSYKGFGPSTKSLEGIDVEKIPSLQEQPVQSAIMVPKSGSSLNPGPNLIQGYAYSGGGRGIVRVDVSCDGGLNWQTASLTAGSEQPLDRAWAWTFFESVVDLPDISPPTSITPTSTVQIICKATDASYNVQPDTVAGIWNLRGINNNAWHRVNVQIIPEEIVDDEDEEDEEVEVIAVDNKTVI